MKRSSLGTEHRRYHEPNREPVVKLDHSPRVERIKSSYHYRSRVDDLAEKIVNDLAELERLVDITQGKTSSKNFWKAKHAVRSVAFWVAEICEPGLPFDPEGLSKGSNDGTK